MSPSERVLIPHDNYRFDTVGRWHDGRQFLACVTGAIPGANHYRFPNDWLDVKRWLAVIHVFAADGTHLTTEARHIGFAREEPQLQAKLEAMFAQLLADYHITPDLYGKIEIKPFQAVVDDIYYELVYESEEIEGRSYEQAILWPNNLAFYPPWDGRYDT